MWTEDKPGGSLLPSPEDWWLDTQTAPLLEASEPELMRVLLTRRQIVTKNPKCYQEKCTIKLCCLLK